MKPLAGKLALVTGASRGIGRATMEAMIGAGATVIGMARSLGDDESGTRITRCCDLTDSPLVEQTLARLVDRFGLPDIVVNNAGAFVLGSLGETTVEAFRGQLETNLTAPFVLLNLLVPQMLERNSGHVVTIGSIADQVALPGNSAYGASKYGMRGLHEVLSEELRGSGIRMTLVSPGATDTSLWDDSDPDSRDDLPSRSSMLRPGDVADAVLYAVTRAAGVSVDSIRVSPA